MIVQAASKHINSDKIKRVMTEPYYLGVDLGGTQLRMAAVTSAGRLASSMFSVPTGKEFSPESLRENLQALAGKVRAEIGEHPIAAIGMGITGQVFEIHMGNSDFLPLLNGVNLIALVTESLDLPAKIENDARCFVLAEARFGAGRGLQNVVGITLGTGVGGGVIVHGKIVHGANRYAGEVWSIPLRGKWLEHFVSGSGIVQTYKENGGEVTEIDAAKIAELARNGDAIAQKTYDAFAEDLWALCETIRSLLDPDVVVIGGSIANARDVFGEYLQQRLNENGPKIAWAELGDAAGVIGAASLTMD